MKYFTLQLLKFCEFFQLLKTQLNLMQLVGDHDAVRAS